MRPFEPGLKEGVEVRQVGLPAEQNSGETHVVTLVVLQLALVYMIV